MNHLLESHIAALEAAWQDHGSPELPDGDYFDIVEGCLDAALPERLVDSEYLMACLRNGLERLLCSMTLKVVEQCKDDLNDSDVMAYLERRHDEVNRAHADNPTSENLDELELLGRLLRR